MRNRPSIRAYRIELSYCGGDGSWGADIVAAGACSHALDLAFWLRSDRSVVRFMRGNVEQLDDMLFSCKMTSGSSVN